MRIWGGHILPEQTIGEVLRAVMMSPFSPIQLDIMSAEVEFCDFEADDEFAKYRDWRHSTWQECLRLCKAANVRVPVIFHHLPSRDDRALDAIAAAAAQKFPGAVVAREGDTLVP